MDEQVSVGRIVFGQIDGWERNCPWVSRYLGANRLANKGSEPDAHGPENRQRHADFVAEMFAWGRIVHGRVLCVSAGMRAWDASVRNARLTAAWRPSSMALWITLSWWHLVSRPDKPRFN